MHLFVQRNTVWQSLEDSKAGKQIACMIKSRGGSGMEIGVHGEKEMM